LCKGEQGESILDPLMAVLMASAGRVRMNKLCVKISTGANPEELPRLAQELNLLLIRKDRIGTL
jgi:hypothetical protein